MIEQVRAAYRYLFVLGLGAVLLAISIMVPVISSSADFSIYNTGWNGCSDLGKETYETGSFLPTIDLSATTKEVVAHRSFASGELDINPAATSIIIIGPEVTFTREEGEFTHEFLTEGGVMLIADDFGTGNDLLSYLETSTRISGRKMVDLSFMKIPELSVSTDMAQHRITRNVSMLLFNYPSTVIPSISAVPIVNSSQTSWLENEEDTLQTINEGSGPFPILTIERYGEGALIVLSEPSLLINQMKKKMDNGLFASNLIHYLSEGRNTILIDEAHHDLNDPVHIIDSFQQGFDPAERIGLLIGLCSIFLMYEVGIHRKLFSMLERLQSIIFKEDEPDRPDRDDIFRSLMLGHPTWDEVTLNRLMDDIEGV
ncbi:MAG: hypothetical protein KAH57_06100 [Thermoplasmata archaeon]|nr:hypothetical protein [Thermoplasmata archaeon]